jgi:leucine-rich PPR motif-containing protein
MLFKFTCAVESLAKKFAEHGDVAPINVLWMHYFVTGRPEEARDLWNKYLANTPRLMFQWVCQTARRTANPILAANLFSMLGTSQSTTPGARGNALSCLLDVLSE